MRGAVPRSAAVIAAALLAVILVPAVVLAHQALRSSQPAEGDAVVAVPDTLRLTFYEPVRMDFTEVSVEGPDGLLDVGGLATAEGEPTVLLVPVEGGWHPGDFEVRWRTVGADGHPSDGRFSFTVAEDAAGLPAADETEPIEPDTLPVPVAEERPPPDARPFGPESPGYVAVRWLTFLALIGGVGAIAYRFAILPLVLQLRREVAAPLLSDTMRRAATLGLAAAVLLLVAGLARLWAQTAALFTPGDALSADRWMSTLSLQPWGTGWWLQMGAGALAVLGFAVARRGSVAGWGVAAAAVVAAAVTPALSGHAAATGDIAALAVTVDTLHVLGAGGWVGGLALLLLAGVPAALRLEEGRRGPAVAALVKGFSPAALLFAGIVVSTGVFSAWMHLGEVSALWTTAYGRTLLLKLAIFSGVFLLGAYNLLRVRPALGDAAGTRRIRASGGIELFLAVVVLAVTAVLVALPTPMN